MSKYMSIPRIEFNKINSKNVIHFKYAPKDGSIRLYLIDTNTNSIGDPIPESDFEITTSTREIAFKNDSYINKDVLIRYETDIALYV